MVSLFCGEGLCVLYSLLRLQAHGRDVSFDIDCQAPPRC